MFPFKTGFIPGFNVLVRSCKSDEQSNFEWKFECRIPRNIILKIPYFHIHGTVPGNACEIFWETKSRGCFASS